MTGFPLFIATCVIDQEKDQMKHPQASSSRSAPKSSNLRLEATTGTGLPKPGENLRDIILKSYVHGNVLDLSKASDFYQREAAVAEVLAEYVERLPGPRYKLKNGFDAFFHQSWAFSLLSHSSQPADALAHSLFKTAQAWTHSKYVDSWPGDWRCTRTEALSNEWKQSWKRMSEQDWDSFRQMSSPLAAYIVTALDEKGNVDHRLCYVPTVRHVCLGISFQQNMRLDPEMRILIKGDPAVSFMIAYLQKSRKQQWSRRERQELMNLRMIFKSAVSTIEKEFLGLTGPKGRPRDVGERAAYLLYHEKKPIRLVSRELCALRQEPNHICDLKCHDKMKKAAGNHFKQLKRELQSRMKSSRKESL
jgi:hypothetical protein